MKSFSRVIIVILSLSFVSCASYFKRKECEKTNWFDFGKKQALSGERVDDSHFYKQCKKVEAEIQFAELDRGFKVGMGKYCTPDEAYNVGRRGDKMNFNLCDVNLKNIRAQHNKGVNDFCQPRSGYQAGAKGWVYNNICPKELEAKFIPQYEKGRRTYLRGQIEIKEEEVKSLDLKIRRNEREIRDLRHQVSTMQGGKKLTQKRVYDPVKKEYRTEVSIEDSQEMKDAKQDLEWKLSRKESEYSRMRTQQDRIRKEVNTLKTELRALQYN